MMVEIIAYHYNQGRKYAYVQPEQTSAWSTWKLKQALFLKKGGTLEESVVKLSAAERSSPEAYVNKGRHSTRAIKRARVLLLLDQSKSGKEASALAGVSGGTVSNIKTRYAAAQGNLTQLVEDKPRPRQPPKVTQQVEAHIPRLPAAKPWGKESVDSALTGREGGGTGLCRDLSHEALRKCLKKASSGHGKRSSGASAK